MSPCGLHRDGAVGIDPPGWSRSTPTSFLRADLEARWARWQRARQAGVLSPNDVRREEGWPASTDPTADSIEPPVAGGKPAGESSDDPLSQSRLTADEPAKVALLDQHRGRHA